MQVMILIAILFVLMSLVGQNRGAKSFIVLVLNSFTVLMSLIALSHNWNPMVIFIISSFVFSILTIVFQNEYNIKTLAAFLSTLIVISLLSILIQAICSSSHLSGLNEIESRVDGTEYYSLAVNINMYYILIISLIWGELGAIADTGISISSALNEINSNNSGLSSLQLFKSGLSIGKDIIGTTVNTLSFVTLGESILLLLLYHINNYSFVKTINSKSFLQEISTILLSCIGCIMIIPITAILFSLLVKSTKVNRYFSHREEKN